MKLRGGLSNWVLIALEKSVDGYVRLDDFIHNPGFYAYSSERQLKKSELARAVKTLRENGLVEFISDQELAIKLTEEGRDHAIWAKLKMVDEKWDGRWRLVIFDIPEKRRAARDLFRLRLKQWGFKYFQGSVWISKKNCTKELRRFVKQAGIGDWVKVIESDNIDD